MFQPLHLPCFFLASAKKKKRTHPLFLLLLLLLLLLLNFLLSPLFFYRDDVREPRLSLSLITYLSLSVCLDFDILSSICDVLLNYRFSLRPDFSLQLI
ncbi:hypothetical protein TRV_06537 [Trichophyton verrucosum HKI 0517]|uniref:Uncharacterized protein n=1 Tax=Trichophyton verrucosum (strain HKI 0517) TaxID=663202 RepID=D4DH82_TRIVH|nr:uncharacterized protein TRV_06537 [Trichophyton verrucosum HKI 0517]EFE38812.1 hypothetical protein TRV_06537 [Trichophyton verrucosum HKI 0517]